jgi:RNA polymerase sigma-70 factor, ECF subfamily
MLEIDLDCAQIAQEEDDEILIQAFRQNPAEFAQIYRRYASRVYRYLYGRTGNGQDAEDLTTLVFTEVFEKLPRYHLRSSFAAWLFTVARHRAIDRFRKKHDDIPLECAYEVSSPGQDPLGLVIDAEAQQRLSELYSQLPDAKRELIRLRFAARLSYSEISQVMGHSEAAVTMAMHRILEWMKEHWEVEHE